MVSGFYTRQLQFLSKNAESFENQRVPFDTTMVPGKRFHCFHLAEEKAEAEPCQVTTPRSYNCPNRICTHVYQPRESELGAAVSHHEGYAHVNPEPSVQNISKMSQVIKA